MHKRIALISLAIATTVGIVSVALSTNPTEKTTLPQASTPQEPQKATVKYGCGGFKKFLAEKLGLSEEQIAQIRALKQDFKSQMRNMPPEERKAKWQEFKEQVRNVLTPEQRAKWDELKAQWKVKRAQGHLKKIGGFIKT
ncbi:MAG: hypothetical protein QXI19_14145 [Candidatus Caldarchaeum sp.]